MKKKLLIVALVTALVLLTGTIVGFAVDAANKSAEAKAAALAEAKAAEKEAAAQAEAKAAQKELEIQKVLSELQVSPDSEAGQVLIEVLSKKEMTEREIMIYNEMSDEIKKMDYEAVSAKLQEYADVEATLATKPWNEAMQDEAFRERVAQMLIYKEYAEAIAVGEPLYEQNHKFLSDYHIHGIRMAEEHLAEIEKIISADPDKEPYMQREIFEREQSIKISELAGDMLEIFEQNKAAGYNIDQLNKDMQDLLSYLSSEKRLYNNTSITVSHDYSYIITRYLAGETVEDIVG